MTELREKSGLSEAVKLHLRKVALRGLVYINDSKHGGVHGTGLATINALFNTGVIRGQSFDLKRRTAQVGDISIYPTTQIIGAIKDIPSPTIFGRLTKSPETSVEEAKEYARHIAKRQHFLETVGISGDEEAYYMTIALFSFPLLVRDCLGYFKDRGVPPKILHSALQTAKERQGFLLGISPDIVVDPAISLHEGDNGDADIRLRTYGKGLPYKYISGIQALGPIEEEYLKKHVF